MNSTPINIYQLPESSQSSGNRPKLSLPSGVFSASNIPDSLNFAAKALNTDLTNMTPNSSSNSSSSSQKPSLNLSQPTQMHQPEFSEPKQPFATISQNQLHIDSDYSNQRKPSNPASLSSQQQQQQPSFISSNCMPPNQLGKITNSSNSPEPQIVAPNCDSMNRPTLSISISTMSPSVSLNSTDTSSISGPRTNSSHSRSNSSSIDDQLSPSSDYEAYEDTFTGESPISNVPSALPCNTKSEHSAMSIPIPVPQPSLSNIIPPANLMPQPGIPSLPNHTPLPNAVSLSNSNQADSSNLAPPLPPFPFPVKKSPSKTILAALSIPTNPNVPQKSYLPDPVPLMGAPHTGNPTSTTPLSLHSDDSAHSSSDSSGLQSSGFLEPASTDSSNHTLSVNTPLSRPSTSPVSGLTVDVAYVESVGGFRTDSTIVPPRSTTSINPSCSIGSIASVGNIGSIGGPGSITGSNTPSLSTSLSPQQGTIDSSCDMDTSTLTKKISGMNIDSYSYAQQEQHLNYTGSSQFRSDTEYRSAESTQETISQTGGSLNTQLVETTSTFTSSYSSAPKLRPSNYEKYAHLDVQDLDEEGWCSVAAAGDIEELGRLGEGAGGSVTRCRLRGRTGKNGHGSVFALKAITTNPNPEVQKQILRELQFNRSCNSLHIVKYYGTFLSEETASIFIAMEYCGGGSLEAIYKRVKVRGGRIGEKVLGKIAEGVLSGLSYLHERRIIHRDIKPQNILLGSEGQVKLCDFGVSGEVVNSLATTFTGTSYYMAPERIQGQPYTVTSDVWSLGLTIMEVAQHRFPFLPESHEPLMPIELLSIIVNMPAPELKDEPEEGIKWSESFRHFLKSCLEKDPKKRASPRQMLGHPWIVGQRHKVVKMAKFVRECWS